MEQKNLAQIAQEKILLLDGAMGTMIQKYKLEEKDFRGERFKSHPNLLQGNNDLLCLTRPDIILKIHLDYLESGADIIETNTFNAQRVSLADYGLEPIAYELNLEAARIARKAVDQFTSLHPGALRFVAGAIGPTNKTASLSPEVNDPGFRSINFDELVLAYKEQVNGLLDGGVDILLVETIFDTLNAKAALFAILEIAEERKKSFLLPTDVETGEKNQIALMVSGTITDASGRTLSGQTAEAFLVSMSHAPLFSIGFNCALGAAQLKQFVEVLSDNVNCLVSAYPNAGLPNEMGHYDQSPSEMANLISEYCERKIVNIVGGCCGTTPEHIAAMAKITSSYTPRVVLPVVTE